MIIREMRDSDVKFAVECTKREGWTSETEHVFRAFLRYDSAGCLIGQEDKRPVGMCVAVAYGDSGFLGELIVVPDRRRLGLGRQLLERGIDYLRTRGCHSIYLDGDEKAVPLYERIGFRHLCKSCRFYGRVEGRSESNVRAMAPEDMGAVERIDAEAFGADRRFFLKYRLQHFPRLCKVACTEGVVSAFCMGQPGHRVVSVGPWVVVGDYPSPLDLLESLAVETGAAPLRIGILESNSKALREVRTAKGLAEASPSWRMVLGPDTGLGASEQSYAIGSASKG